MFDTGVVVLSIASSLVAVYLISQDPEFITVSGKACSHLDQEANTIGLGQDSCPSNSPNTVCSGRGTCQADLCTCDEGWVGEDCSQHACPEDCSGRGTCYEGFCVCDNGWAGTSCAIDRLQVTTKAMLEGVDFEAFTKTSECHFFSRELFDEVTMDSKFGKFEYVSVGKSRTETYRFPLDKMKALPEACPDYRFGTCAFVGNSGTLKLSNFGSEIDGHEMVYRFNQAPTVGYESHVGSQTTFESLNAKHAHNLLRQDTKWNWRDPVPVYLLFEPLKLKETLTDIHDKFPHVQILVLSPAFFRKAHEIYYALQAELERHEFGCFSGEKPMSGFYSLLIASTMCDAVDMYGFEPWEDWMAQGELHYHYFDSEEPRPGAHSFDATFFMYKMVEMSGKLGVHMRGINATEDFERERRGSIQKSVK